MLRLKRKSALATFFSVFLLVGNAVAQSSAGPSQPENSSAASKAAKSGQHHSARRAKTPTPEQQAVQAPPPPPTPEQMAPVAPNVSYQAGQLTIQSNNATLAQVLRSVQAKTGASFDIPASANSDRVVAQLGPGQPRDVLATLLNGSKFNYIILGSPNQPGSVQKLILTPRQNVPITNTAQIATCSAGATRTAAGRRLHSARACAGGRQFSERESAATRSLPSRQLCSQSAQPEWRVSFSAAAGSGE